MMEKPKKIPGPGELIQKPEDTERSEMQKTRGISSDMVADAEAMFRVNPVVARKLSSTNHRKKTEKLPPNNYIG